MNYRVFRTWLSWDYVEVEAQSREEAAHIANLQPIDSSRSEYVNDSMTIDMDEIEELP